MKHLFSRAAIAAETGWEGEGVHPDVPTAPDDALVRGYSLAQRSLQSA